MKTKSSCVYDWLVYRIWNKPIERVEICLLTTRGYLLSRIVKRHVRENLKRIGTVAYTKVPGLRRYRTEGRAKNKAAKLNEKFNTTGYKFIREDKI